MSYYRRIIWPALVGIGAGFLIIQPLIVLIYNLAPQTEIAFHKLSFWKRLLDMTLDPTSIFMGLAFAVLGGITGLFFGSWLYHRDCLFAEKLESQQRLAALETLKNLMVTLAHYIRNANMVIGGFSNLLARNATDPQMEEQLHLIHRASQEIEAVIDSLQQLTEITTAQYMASGTARMIDLKKELDERLAAKKLKGES